jgi:hypothetical protein
MSESVSGCLRQLISAPPIGMLTIDRTVQPCITAFFKETSLNDGHVLESFTRCLVAFVRNPLEALGVTVDARVKSSY